MDSSGREKHPSHIFFSECNYGINLMLLVILLQKYYSKKKELKCVFIKKAKDWDRDCISETT